MKKVLILTYYWPPSGGAGVQRWLKFVKYLPEYGFTPYVLAPDPAFAAYPVRDNRLEEDIPEEAVVIRTKTREPFNLYKKISNKKDIPYSGFANQKEPGWKDKIFRMIRGNLFIPDARKGWNQYALKAAKNIIKEEGIKTVITTGPPHSTHLIGMKLKKKMNISWIADFRDPWTDIYYYDKLYSSILARKLDKKYESKVLASADTIMVVSHHMKKMLANKTIPFIDHIIKIIPNGFDKEDFPISAEKPNGKFIITYTGVLSEEYDTDCFLQVLSSVIKESRIPIILQFVGVVSPQVKKNIKQYDLQSITIYTDYVSHREALKFMIKSTVLFLAIPHTQGNKAILSGKLFEYIATGKPVVGIGPSGGDAATVLNECGCGKMFDYTDSQGMNTYLLDRIQRWEQNAEQLLNKNPAIQKYSRKSLTGKLVDILEKLI